MEGLQRNYGFEFPDDVSQNIIGLLPVWDVCSLAACSRHWRILCSSNFVWYSLYKKRWSLENMKNSRAQDSLKYQHSNHSSMILNPASPISWQAEYIYLHRQMVLGAASVIDYVKERACFDSMEVADYQKAMNLLSSSGLQCLDVEIFLLVPKLSVLINLLGLHYCLTHLKMKEKEAREALSRNKVGERQVCLRWWSLGGWTNGFRRHDEMHMRISSLLTLAELEPPSFLEVIDRGTLHEVLRVQISADFESSAWVARSMHSQR
ncbi:hypothetical protein GOP47_0000616 [Adiantum capillus-veneris]|uniref:F-box domain-containing protein n=1 Tax=Adiantum capillus-veneris TaxID=13818 RepID=A0A9D4VFG2_ADICA|nr:hypothetical protein GOP47_0000616 [Adiantum capillus-veneris]